MHRSIDCIMWSFVDNEKNNDSYLKKKSDVFIQFRRRDGWVDRCTDRWMDGQTDRRMNEWRDRWVERQLDG